MVSTVFILTGLLTALGSIGHWLFRRSGIPDVLVLVFAGFLLGPIWHVIDPAQVQPAAPLLSALALVVIVFDGGLGLNLFKVLGGRPPTGRCGGRYQLFCRYQFGESPQCK